MREDDREDLLVLSSASEDGEAYEYLSEDEPADGGKGLVRAKRTSRSNGGKHINAAGERSETPQSNDTAASTAGVSPVMCHVCPLALDAPPRGHSTFMLSTDRNRCHTVDWL